MARISITRTRLRESYSRQAYLRNPTPFVSVFELETLSTYARFAAVVGYGYILSLTQIADLNTKYKLFKNVLARIPEVYATYRLTDKSRAIR